MGIATVKSSLLGWGCAGLLLLSSVAAEPPVAKKSATPASVSLTAPSKSAERQNLWQGLKADPAPILVFGGEDYFPVHLRDDGAAYRGGVRRWEFVRDREDFSHASRLIIVKIEPVHNLRAYEKAVVAKMGVQGREVHYRNPQHVMHSWVATRNGKTEYRLMDWTLRSDGLQCCEMVVRDAIFPVPGVSPQWRKELDSASRQVYQFLPVRE